MSKELDTELLIALIEARPVLWDKTSPIYKNRHETKEAWKEVCIQIQYNTTISMFIVRKKKINMVKRL
ncbi:unnamed protein product [Acanthoscelides obtectus]|uniref:MADF domain-containing protein n=1 Tax=Acanthoscelides obtectus TaxID=200917 RepID=A0A9P0PHZ3_ACAOB|nr:unnamed protein product [Acanthoscelides obtectus]CAK1680947.1 hypothetical protein AOBTE_LOCUS32954 [Acanthoscelides obtectus]